MLAQQLRVKGNIMLYLDMDSEPSSGDGGVDVNTEANVMTEPGASNTEGNSGGDIGSDTTEPTDADA